MCWMSSCSHGNVYSMEFGIAKHTATEILIIRWFETNTLCKLGCCMWSGNGTTPDDRRYEKLAGFFNRVFARPTAMHMLHDPASKRYWWLTDFTGGRVCACVCMWQNGPRHRRHEDVMRQKSESGLATINFDKNDDDDDDDDFEFVIQDRPLSETEFPLKHGQLSNWNRGNEEFSVRIKFFRGLRKIFWRVSGIFLKLINFFFVIWLGFLWSLYRKLNCRRWPIVLVHSGICNGTIYAAHSCATNQIFIVFRLMSKYANAILSTTKTSTMNAGAMKKKKTRMSTCMFASDALNAVCPFWLVANRIADHIDHIAHFHTSIIRVYSGALLQQQNIS